MTLLQMQMITSVFGWRHIIYGACSILVNIFVEYMKTLKDFIRQKVKPEESMSEKYLLQETMITLLNLMIFYLEFGMKKKTSDLYFNLCYILIYIIWIDKCVCCIIFNAPTSNEVCILICIVLQEKWCSKLILGHKDIIFHKINKTIFWMLSLVHFYTLIYM